MNAEFTPNKNTLKHVDTFRHWCQKVLPLVYDDSLSYYELLCKVTNYLNETISNVELLGEDVGNLYTAYEQLQGFVNEYFNELDVQEEINVKLDNMAKSGDLDAILRPIVSEYEEQVKVLDSRITNLASLSEGSTTGDAELLDSRVDYTGKTWDSLGEHLRGVAGEIADKVVDVNTELFPYHTISGWVNKQIGGNNGVFGGNTTRMSVYGYLSKNIRKVGVAENSNLVFVIYGWDSNGNYIGGWINGEWKTSDFAWYDYIDLNDIYSRYPNYQLKISAKYRETADIDVAEGEKVLFYTSNIESLISDVTVISENVAKVIDNEWLNGLRQCAWRGCMNVYENGVIKAYAPENSFPAFRKGIEEKMDYMWLAGIAYTEPESDDCDLYIMHDANLVRTTGVDGVIRNMTSAEVDAIPLLTRGDTVWCADDLRIPRFEDCIKLALRNKQKLGLRIGIPAPNTTSNRQLLWNKFFGYCDKYNLLDAIYSGDIEQARVVNAHNPMLHVQTTGSSVDTVDEVLTALELLHTEGFKNCSHIVYYDALASGGEAIMSKAREYGIKIFAVNLESTNPDYLADYEKYKQLYTDLCVDGVITHHKIDMNF